MQRDRQRLGEDGSIKRKLGREEDALPGGDDQAGPKASLRVRQPGRGAEKAHVLAEVRGIVPARSALAAGPARVDRDLVSRLDPPHRLPDPRHRAGYLMPEDERLPDHGIAHPAPVKVVQIGPTDPADGDRHLDLVRTHRLRVDVIDAKIACTMCDNRPHQSTDPTQPRAALWAMKRSTGSARIHVMMAPHRLIATA
jgi:hypothetical protein